MKSSSPSKSSSSSKEVNSSVLFSDLLRFGQNNEWQKCLKTANRILQLGEDAKAFHCKIVAMVQLSQFEEAVNQINRNQKMATDLGFEKAYCLYRLNKTREAQKVLESIEKPNCKTKELLGQVCYRLEEYDECLEIYLDLMRHSDDEYEEERKTNLSAVVVHLLAAAKGGGGGGNAALAEEVLSGLDDHASYELSYNNACALIAREKYAEAEEKLEKAEVLCKKTFEEEEDLPEEEVEAEVGIIRVQQGFVHHIRGSKERANQLYSQVLKHKPSDAALLAVVSNNVVALNKDQNVFDSKKKMKSATSSGLEHKLTSQQRAAIALNQCLLSLATNQFEVCRDQLKASKTQFPNHVSEFVLVEASLLCKEKDVQGAIQCVKDFVTSSSALPLSVWMALAQLLLLQGEVREACSTLRNLGEISYSPGIVSALVSLYLSVEEKKEAEKILEDALHFYKTNKSSSGALVVLWREAANFHLKQGNPEGAARSLEQLKKIYPKDEKILAQLIAMYSRFDMKRALLASKDLPPPLEEENKKLDVDLLESTAWAMGLRYFKKGGGTKGGGDPSPPTTTAIKGSGGGSSSRKVLQEEEEDAVLMKKKKRKKRKKVLGKNYDPSVDPDPERWLPKRDRTTFKKKKDRRVGGASGTAATGGGAVGRGTQGSTIPNDADVTSGGSPRSTQQQQQQQQPTSPSSSSSSAAPQGPRQQRPQGAQKKKKKKGAKW